VVKSSCARACGANVIRVTEYEHFYISRYDASFIRLDEERKGRDREPKRWYICVRKPQGEGNALNCVGTKLGNKAFDTRKCEKGDPFVTPALSELVGAWINT
jgi:hypothetical protein